MKRFISSKPFAQQTLKETLGIIGNVRQAVQICYEVAYKNGETVEGEIDKESAYPSKNFNYTFNEAGYRTESVEFSINRKWTRYREDRQVAESIEYNKKGSVTQTTVNTFNAAGKITESLSLNADGSVSSKQINVYAANGTTKTEDYFFFRNDEKAFRRTVYTYNDAGDNTFITYYKTDDVVERTSETIYNEAGQRTEHIYKYADDEHDTFNLYQKFKYNSHGDLIEQAEYNTDGSLKKVLTFTHEYDNKGKKIIPATTPHDAYELGENEKEKLEFDSKGNWIKRTVIFRKKPVSIYVRQFVYADEPAEKKLEHPLEKPSTEDDDDDTPEYLGELSEADAKWLAEGSTQPEIFPLVRYYTFRFKQLPCVILFNDININAMKLLKLLKKEMYAQVVHTYSTAAKGYLPRLGRYTVCFRDHPGYMLYAPGITERDIYEFSMPAKESSMDDVVYTSQMVLYCPCEAYGNRDSYIEEMIGEYIDKSTLQKKPDKPYINMIEVDNNGFVMQEHAVDDDFEIDDLDVNYGEGFEKFDEDLMQRFNTSTKGLVLFHGEPGTGKTYYIRHLLRKMVANNKIVIYMPPNMVDHLTEPAFMTFLTTEVKNWSEEGNFCVLLIEDAEPLLTKRKEGVRIQGVTNLLNMSDGLLNDMLNLQIICTFNVGLTKLDSALLRPGV